MKIKFSLIGLVLLLPLSAFAEIKDPHQQPVNFCAHEDTYYMRLAERQSAPIIKNQKLGALTVFSFVNSKEINGPQVGVTISTRTDLDLKNATVGPHSMMQTEATTFLPGGTLVSLKVVDYDQHLLAKETERPVLGGTGKYRNANGISIVEPLTDEQGKKHYKLTLKLLLPCNQLP